MKPDFSALAPLKQPGEFTSKTPYILCNEQNQADTLNTLGPIKSTLAPPIVTTTTSQNLQKTEGTNINKEEEDKTTPTEGNSPTKLNVHIGFSVWFNLDLISVTKPDCAIIFDIDSKVYAVYQIIEKALKTSDSAEEFVKNLSATLMEDKDLISETEAIYLQATLLEQLQKVHGFLSSKEAYNTVKQMYEEGRIFFGSANLTNPAHIELIVKWCHDNNLNIETLYLSNIPEWIMEYAPKEAKENFLANANNLITPNKTIVIDAFYPTNVRSGSGPPQRTTIGELPLFEKKTAKKYAQFKFKEEDKEPDQDDKKRKNPDSDNKGSDRKKSTSMARKLF